MTTRQSHRALRRAFYPVLESNGFRLDKTLDGVAAARDRGLFHDKVSARVVWTLPRVVEVSLSVRSDALNEFLGRFWSAWALDQPNGQCNLGTFERGADPFRSGGARRGWDFEGAEPPEILLQELKQLLDAACKHLESIRDANAHADLIREHAFATGRRPAPVLAGALAYAGRFTEAADVCRAAMESNEAALTQHVSYAPQARPLLQPLLTYCEARA